jgi:glucosamine-6-phosphate deaminase
LEPDDPRLFSSFLNERIFKKVPFKNVFYMSGEGKTQDEILANYACLLEQYPVDITFMGIGENGHIAFNDPHVADFQDKQRIKVVDLDEKSRMQQVHDGCFDKLESVPKYAITLTIPSLTRASRIFCIIPAQSKATAVKNTVFGVLSEKCPATILRRHPDATLYLDADAGKYLLER